MKLELMRQSTLRTQHQELVSTLFNLVGDRRITELNDFLVEMDCNLAIELPSLFDMADGGKSLLHKCTHVKSVIILERLIGFYRESYMKVMQERKDQHSINEIAVRRRVRKNISDWINEKTQDDNRFTAMHFAAYNGEPALIRALHKFGADLELKNGLGLTPLHVAAQGDKAFALTFLVYHGAEVDALDNDE